MGDKYPRRPILPPYRTAAHELILNPAATDKISSRISSVDIGAVSISRQMPPVFQELALGKITVTYPQRLHPESEEVQQAVQDAVLRALKKEAAALLPPMVEGLAAAHGFRCRSVAVRATRSRWGSCSGRDDISLSVYLILLPRHLIEYIILHELCHTVHKNHSAAFHELLNRHLDGREKQYIGEIRSYRPEIF
jgi:predicted metal-dependent hydrolase